MEQFAAMKRRIESMNQAQTRRALFIVVSLFAMAAAPVIGRVYSPSDSYVLSIWLSVNSCFSCFTFLRLVTGRSFGDGWVIALLYANALGLFASDVILRGVGRITWPIFVCVIDALLVAGVPTMVTSVLVAAVVFYLLLMYAETVLRMGVLDFPGSISQSLRREELSQMLDCDTVPCPRNAADTLGDSMTPLIVFVLDYIVTRGFSVSMVNSQKRLEKTIDVMQHIADLLANYDIETVSEVLDERQSSLPPKVCATLRTLERNLRLYKPYLPQSCFQDDFRGEEEKQDGTEKDSGSASTATVSSSSSASTPLNVPVPAASVRQLRLTASFATLLVVNIKNSLSEEATDLSSLFSDVLTATLAATGRGVVDLFVGDKIHCSFNTSRRCATHAVAAVHMAKGLAFPCNSDVSDRVNVGISSGKVLMGEMGCLAMRRFSVFGKLLQEVQEVERVGRAVGSNVVCSLATFKDAECEHRMRLLPLSLSRRDDGTGEALIVADLVVGARDTGPGARAGEWLYHVGAMQEEWATFNNAVRKYLDGLLSAEAAIASAGEKGAVLEELMACCSGLELQRTALHKFT